MNGKELKKYHRAAMHNSGGLVRETGDGGEERLTKTGRYVSLRAWLRSQGNKIINDAAATWRGHKQAQRHRGRIKGLNDPHSPSRMKRMKKEQIGTADREQQLKKAREANAS